jgi:hypothetical protein
MKNLQNSCRFFSKKIMPLSDEVPLVTSHVPGTFFNQEIMRR